ncbi:hypothetical protein VTN00DRAFT_970 [Thermoascus crustaceus]|uniref:uncharacterized protein n=1 Tax=Thermoascus crustaceus TaxID=5088 RepID=UPI0037431F68
MLKRSRKLVTYSRSLKEQTSKDRENIEYERSSPVTITSSKGDRNGELHPKPGPTFLGNGNLDSGKSLTSSCDGSQKTKSTAKGASIYDFPSSGDELRDDFGISKKRRKLTPGGCKSHSHYLSNSGRPISQPTLDADNSRQTLEPLEYFPVSAGDALERSSSVRRPFFDKNTENTKTSSALATAASTMHKRRPAQTTSNEREGRGMRSSNDYALTHSTLSPSSEGSPAPKGDSPHLRQYRPIDEYLASQSRHVKTRPGHLSSSISNPSNSSPTLHTPTTKISSRKRLVDALDVRDHFMKDSLMDSTGENRSTTSDCFEVSPDGIHQTHNLSHSESCDMAENRNIAPSKSGGSKITYARQRSFLSDFHILGGVQEGPVDLHRRPSIEQQKPDGSISAVQVLIDSGENNSSGSVRSIHELRQAGENARFRGAVDSLFEDIEDTSSPVSSRRSSFIQLCGKLADRQFTRRFLESGFDRRLAGCLSNKLDVISAYLAVCAYGLIMSVGPLPSTVLTSFWPKILESSPPLLEMEDDILVLSRNRCFNLSKASQEAVHALCSRLRESTLAIDMLPSQLSPQLVALRCIQLTICKCRERGDKIDRIPESLLGQLVGLLLQRSSKLQDASFTLNDYPVLELTLFILEAYTTLPGSLGGGRENVLKGLSRLGDFVSSLEGYNESRCRRIQALFIRLLLNITNNNPSLCEEFATPELIKALVGIVETNFKDFSGNFVGKNDDSLDIVILALGALINLTEESGKSRKLFIGSNAGPGSSLDRFLHLFSTGLDVVSEADCVVQTHFNVAFGYLSILLSMLCLDPDARSHIRNSLNGDGLSLVLTTVEEFIHYHQKVEEERDQSTAEDPIVEFTSRLQGIVNLIRQSERQRSI